MSGRLYRDTVIFIQFEAMPTQAVAERDNVAGAYVNCWVQTRDPEQAEARGRHWIAQEGWVIVSMTQWRPVDVDAETRGPDAEYILEALRADGSIVFHRWSPAGEVRAD
jgi:hypothetical protein